MSNAAYVDKELLDCYIRNSCYKVSYIVKMLGISSAAFYKKKNGDTPFRASEIFVLVTLLEISPEDKSKIFKPR